jgi:(p)ppGpp synthase/HD superfamily hydrolase
VRRELLGKRVLVFTPSGRIVNLPKGSTVLNAMDHLHPSISPLQLRAEVNGVPVPVWYTLQTGQTLEVTLRPKRINIGPLSLTLS